jgi:oxygen-independent coproporphyrinogen-3 oxidase
MTTSHAARSAYIHVPFCRHRCGYCNFTLVAGRDDLIDAYLGALDRELSWLGGPRPVKTLFLGGGTPTHLPPHQLERLLAIARERFVLDAGGEFSVEANPIDIDEERVRVLAAAGVNRISLGAQSFNSAKLKLLERDHSAEQIQAAIAHCRNSIASISLDLIFGVPDESLEDWQADLRSALALTPDHLSTYGLTFERGTSFWSRLQRGELGKTDEEIEGQMYEWAIDTLTAAGFEHYEVSNFARVGHRSRHNETYWTGGEFYAAGPGAARYIDGRREVNHRSTTTYLQRVLAGQSPVAESEQLGPEDAARERLVFGLRRLQGIDAAIFETSTGYSVETLGGPALREYLQLGFLKQEAAHLKLTRRGLLVSDALWPAFLRQ